MFLKPYMDSWLINNYLCKFRASNGNRISSCKQNHNSGFTKDMVKAPNSIAATGYRNDLSKYCD